MTQQIVMKQRPKQPVNHVTKPANNLYDQLMNRERQAHLFRVSELIDMKKTLLSMDEDISYWVEHGPYFNVTAAAVYCSANKVKLNFNVKHVDAQILLSNLLPKRGFIEGDSYGAQRVFERENVIINVVVKS